MSERVNYEALRLENLQFKQALLQKHNLVSRGQDPSVQKQATKTTKADSESNRPAKKQKLAVQPDTPTRSSARIAASPNTRPSYRESLRIKQSPPPRATRQRQPRNQRTPRSKAHSSPESHPVRQPSSPPHPTLVTQFPAILPATLASLIEHWNSWEAKAAPPTQGPFGLFHFPSHPEFTPNKHPLAILQEGAFGGTFFAPHYSTHLYVTIENDHHHTLPSDWLKSIPNHARLLANREYDPEVNKYHVKCGQSLREWESAGWINHHFDPRGWFEWYIRFFLGRRCSDDDRQISRWRKATGPSGRFRRGLLKAYVKAGVRSAFTDDDDEAVEDRPEVSPVMHQTCHHWAYEVRQEDLDNAWREF